MKGKIPQHTTPQTRLRKKLNFEEYLSLSNFKKNPISKDTLIRIFEDYVHWAKNDESALRLTTFPRSRGIPLQTFYNWIDSDPYFKLLHNEAKAAVGDRREILAFMNKANASIFMASAPHYDYNAPDMSWKELQEHKAQLAAQSGPARAEIIYVEDTAFSKTPEEVAIEIHQKTKKYTKPKYEPREKESQEEVEE